MKPLYAFVDVLCSQRVRFPYYMKVLHQQGEAGVTYRIACYSFAEVDYYRQLCKQMAPWLTFTLVRPSKYDIYKQVLDGGPLSVGKGGWRNQIDGKLFQAETVVRNRYVAATF